MKLSNLKPLEKNPFKSKGDEQIKKIGQSIQDFEKMMAIRPIVYDETMNILGGNKRYFALKILGYKDIPNDWVMQVAGWSEAEKREFIVKDNAHWGSTWDNEILQEWNVDLEAWGVDLPAWEEDVELSDDFGEEVQEKKQYFSFSNINSKLHSSGVEYHCLYRNNEMDLESLKENIRNIYPFVIPVLNYLRDNNFKKVAVAPKGGRSEKNGFHFATEILNECKKYIDIDIVDYFVNVKNHISVNENNKEKGIDLLFDDIATRGTTIKKMRDLSNCSTVLVLISNH